MTLWYLSFASEAEWLGAAIVECDTLASALTLTHMLGINPGGSVMSVEVPAERVKQTPDWYRNRLLTEADVKALDALMRGGEGEIVRIRSLDV